MEVYHVITSLPVPRHFLLSWSTYVLCSFYDHYFLMVHPPRKCVRVCLFSHMSVCQCSDLLIVGKNNRCCFIWAKYLTLQRQRYIIMIINGRNAVSSCSRSWEVQRGALSKRKQGAGMGFSPAVCPNSRLDGNKLKGGGHFKHFLGYQVHSRL